MMRLARTATLALVATVCGAGAAAAQSTAAGAANPPWFAELNAAATFGHQASGSVGVEAGYRLNDSFVVVLEGGHMYSVGNADLDSRAQKVAGVVGATATARYRVNYGDVGLRYRCPTSMSMRPYVGFGMGLAEVRAETSFAAASGLALDTVQFGTDLNGIEKKLFVTIGVGATREFGTHYILDLSYRFGRISPKTSAIEGDQATITQRVQAGFGFRF